MSRLLHYDFLNIAVVCSDYFDREYVTPSGSLAVVLGFSRPTLRPYQNRSLLGMRNHALGADRPLASLISICVPQSTILSLELQPAPRGAVSCHPPKLRISVERRYILSASISFITKLMPTDLATCQSPQKSASTSRTKTELLEGAGAKMGELFTARRSG